MADETKNIPVKHLISTVVLKLDDLTDSMIEDTVEKMELEGSLNEAEDLLSQKDAPDSVYVLIEVQKE